MVELQTHTGHSFNVRYAKPARSNNKIFMARINNSEHSVINRIFSDTKSTEELTVIYGDDPQTTITETYIGYTIYLDATTQDDGSIIVRLQKKPEA